MTIKNAKFNNIGLKTFLILSRAFGIIFHFEI
jgi:hypothetical protein